MCPPHTGASSVTCAHCHLLYLWKYCPTWHICHLYCTVWWQAYLIFVISFTHAAFSNFTPKNLLKTPQNTQKCPWKVKYMQFLCSIWKILDLREYFYTGTGHGARNNYQVWVHINVWKTLIMLQQWCKLAQSRCLQEGKMSSHWLYKQDKT